MIIIQYVGFSFLVSVITLCPRLFHWTNGDISMWYMSRHASPLDLWSAGAIWSIESWFLAALQHRTAIPHYNSALKHCNTTLQYNTRTTAPLHRSITAKQYITTTHYNTTLQHRSTTVHYNTAIQHRTTTLLCNTSLQRHSTTSQYNTGLQYLSTALHYNISLQHRSATLQYNTTLQHHCCTAQHYYNTITPQYTTYHESRSLYDW